MATLTRYQKSGGFFQLVSLIEGFGPKKREKFLEIIESENQLWAKALREKLLSVERIVTWDYKFLKQIFDRFQPLHIAAFLHGLENDKKTAVLEALPASKKREVEELHEYMNPSVNEVSSMFLKVISEVRLLVKEGYLVFEEVDATLKIPDNIEEQLASGEYGFQDVATQEVFKPQAVEETVEEDASLSGEKRIENLKNQVLHLKRQMESLITQNRELGVENEKLKILLKDYLKKSA